MADEQQVDVVVVGGGAAGLAGAVALARSLRSVVVVDAGQPRNAPAAHAHNLLGREGVNPLELLAAGRREAEGYGARIVPDVVQDVQRDGDAFVVTLGSGDPLRARRLLLATGLRDELPAIPGVAELWGSSALHCPYCHGYEVRGQRVGVLGSTPMAVHQALLFSQLTPHVTLFRNGVQGIEEHELARLEAIGVRVVDEQVERVEVRDGCLRGVALADGTVVPVDAVTVQPAFVPNAELYERLGGTLADHPMGGRYVAAPGPMGRTELPGVWVAGNVGDLAAMVTAAAAAGLQAGAAINADLVMADADAALLARAGSSH